MAADIDAGLLGQVGRHIEALLAAGEPVPDVETLLIHWTGEPQHQHLLALAARPLMIDNAQLEQEVAEGIGRLVKMLQAQVRRADLNALTDGANVENLRDYWAKHRAKTD